jgi:hypothetical protein
MIGLPHDGLEEGGYRSTPCDRPVRRQGPELYRTQRLLASLRLSPTSARTIKDRRQGQLQAASSLVVLILATAKKARQESHPAPCHTQPLGWTRHLISLG